MQKLADELLKRRGGDCGNGREVFRYRVRGARDAKFVAGGDRLARYLLRQYETASREGYVDAASFLRSAAYTRSDAALDYLSSMLASANSKRDSRLLALTLDAFYSLDRPEALDSLLGVLSVWADTSIPYYQQHRTKVIQIVRSIIEYVEVDRPDVLAVLRRIEWDEDEGHNTRRAAWNALNRFEMYQIAERRNDSPPDLGPLRKVPASLLERSKVAERYWLQRHPEALPAGGCVKRFVHCGLASWAVGDRHAAHE